MGGSGPPRPALPRCLTPVKYPSSSLAPSATPRSAELPKPTSCCRHCRPPRLATLPSPVEELARRGPRWIRAPFLPSSRPSDHARAGAIAIAPSPARVPPPAPPRSPLPQCQSLYSLPQQPAAARRCRQVLAGRPAHSARTPPLEGFPNRPPKTGSGAGMSNRGINPSRPVVPSFRHGPPPPGGSPRQLKPFPLPRTTRVSPPDAGSPAASAAPPPLTGLSPGGVT